ncbi:hypothetical protein GBP346_A1932 [Burkholderia pseudomallei MSHR346]|nr:hypothetical protein GBP346_A1932 [Burkholderia pseudomallei MSHR346]
MAGRRRMRSGRAKTPVALARALTRREPSIARRNRGAALMRGRALDEAATRA